MSKDKDGIEKNIDVVKEEIDNWKVEIQPYMQTYKEASWKDKPHKGANLIVETVRLMPRATMYYIVGRCISDLLLFIGVAVYFFKVS